MPNEISNEQFLEAAKKGILPAACNQAFDTDVQYTIQVADCNNITQADQDKMMSGLMRDWHKQADPICSGLGGACPTLTAVSYVERSNKCQNGTWTIHATITGKCTP